MADHCNVNDKLRECDNGKYHVKDGSILVDSPGRSTMVNMKPDQFMHLVGNNSEPTAQEWRAYGARFDHAEKVNDSICDEEPNSPMFLEVDVDNKKVTSHEGRMRAYVADKVMGERKGIPVKIFCHNENGRKTDCGDITSSISMMRDYEPQNDITEQKYQDRAQDLEDECMTKNGCTVPDKNI